MIDLLAEEAFYADRLNIADLRQQASEVANHADEVSDVYGFVRQILEEDLDDPHSRFMSPSQTERMHRDDVLRGPVPEVSIEGQLITVDLPGVLAGPKTTAGRRYIETVHDALDGAGSACGVLLDLQHDDGGNMFTMLSALAPIVGPGPAVKYVDQSGNFIVDTTIAEDGSVLRSGITDAPAPSKFAPRQVPVAVLQGSLTSSSGEAIVMTFRGRQESRSFGMPTSGLPTATEFIGLPDGSAIMVTGGVGQDSTGKIHDSAIEPDEPIQSSTEAAARAKDWLLNTSSCQAQ